MAFPKRVLPVILFLWKIGKVLLPNVPVPAGSIHGHGHVLPVPPSRGRLAGH